MGALEGKVKNGPATITLIEKLDMIVDDEFDSLRHRLDMAKFKGEALMRELLSVIIETADYQDDIALDFLTNPFTNARLTYDRYYPGLNLAFEFNGQQHYKVTQTYREYRKQRGRDLLKYGFSNDNRVRVIVVKPEELSFASLVRSINNKKLMADLRQKQYIINYLDYCCAKYREKAEEMQQRQRNGASGHDNGMALVKR